MSIRLPWPCWKYFPWVVLALGDLILMPNAAGTPRMCGICLCPHCGMDAFALGLTAAQRIMEDGKLAKMRKIRYESWDCAEAAKFESGKMTLPELAKLGEKGEPDIVSGKQEYIEGLINGYLFG